MLMLSCAVTPKHRSRPAVFSVPVPRLPPLSFAFSVRCAFFSLLQSANPLIFRRLRAPASLFCTRAKINSFPFNRVRAIL